MVKFRTMTIRGLAFAALAGLVLAGTAPSGQAAQKVPIHFDRYHGYTGTVSYIKSVAKAYSNITRLLEIGKSTMGRPIYVLVISNMKTGSTIDAFVKLRHMRKEGVKNVTPMKAYQGKPGHWIGGTTHGNEYTGTEVCLYIIDKLVSGYGSDPAVKKLVDNKTFYICPVINPDGLYNSVEKGIPQRQNSMNRDDDGDGRINEDTYDDLNGDGYITFFRYKDPKGAYIIDSVDSRVMVRLRRGQKTQQQRYSLIMEDKDNDGDGKRGEDKESGIDLNRNFPEGWFTKTGMAGGSGDYPTSAPETHAVVEFFTNHRNIIMAQFYHTSGGFTFRPLGTAPHTQLHPKDVAVFDMIMGKKYLEIIGEEVPEAWKNPGRLAKFKAELKKTSKNKYAAARGYELPRGWRVSYNELRNRRYSYGMATDWAYMQDGIYSITTELWNPLKDIKGFPQIKGPDARVKRERALLQYQDDKYGGKLFVPWKKFKHPELGEGEIGGWIPLYRGNALPGEPLINVCEKHWLFERFRAGLMPEVVITDAKTQILYSSNSTKDAVAIEKPGQVTVKKGKSKGPYKIIEVTLTVENKGKLATQIARGAQLAGLREDVAWLIGDRGKIDYLQGTPFQKLGVMGGTIKIPGYTERSASPASGGQQGGRMPRFFPPGYPMMRFMRGSSYRPTQVNQKGPIRKIKWLVAAQGDAHLKVVVSSQKGGTAVKNLTIH